MFLIFVTNIRLIYIRIGLHFCLTSLFKQEWVAGVPPPPHQPPATPPPALREVTLGLNLAVFSWGRTGGGGAGAVGKYVSVKPDVFYRLLVLDFLHFTAQLNLHRNAAAWPRGYDDVFVGAHNYNSL